MPSLALEEDAHQVVVANTVSVAAMVLMIMLSSRSFRACGVYWEAPAGIKLEQGDRAFNAPLLPAVHGVAFITGSSPEASSSGTRIAARGSPVLSLDGKVSGVE